MKIVIDNKNLLQRIEAYKDAAYKQGRSLSKTDVIAEILASHLPPLAPATPEVLPVFRIPLKRL